MNIEEYSKLPSPHLTFEYKFTHGLLKQWKIDNNYTCTCDIHHGDDTEECRKYNEEHYERWGMNADGTFEYGKYVVFMTHSQHTSYHNNLPEVRSKQSASMRGDKNISKRPEVRAKHSAAMMGDRNPNKRPEVRAKHSASQKEIMKGISYLYGVYKANDGDKSWNEFRKALKTGDITFETRPISVFINGDE